MANGPGRGAGFRPPVDERLAVGDEDGASVGEALGGAVEGRPPGSAPDGTAEPGPGLAPEAAGRRLGPDVAAARAPGDDPASPAGRLAGSQAAATVIAASRSERRDPAVHEAVHRGPDEKTGQLGV